MLGIRKLFSVLVAMPLALVLAAPDFGSNVLIFDSSMSATTIQSQVDAISNKMFSTQFGSDRYALLFKPGTYSTNINIGYYMSIMGLGQKPDDVTFSSTIYSEPVLPNYDGTQNFWRSVENFAIVPTGAGMQWAVSQACPFRRMHIRGNVVLHKYGGWESGGWIADSIVDNDVQSGSQQQWITRSSKLGSWTGSVWNMMFVGQDGGLPGGTWPTTPNTIIDTAPVTREKPFLYIDNAGNYNVFVPSVRTNSKGPSWTTSSQSDGTSISIDKFFVAKPSDGAAGINNALNQGKHILLTPGVYDLTDTIVVNNANTIVMGMGFATLHPTTGKTAIQTADVDGIIISHMLVDAGPTNSPVLVQIGPTGSSKDHSANPTIVQDVFLRVGGAGDAKADVALQINANNAVGDHIWSWRADHGAGAGWNSNPAKNGVVVNGNSVTIYGLFCEHYEQYQTLWNGQNGRTYFYQTEFPYDPPNQASWTSAAGVNGYASYKVADSVNTHEAWALGLYSVFANDGVNVTRAIECPVKSGVKFHHMVTVNLNKGYIQHVINDAGDSTATGIAINTPKVDEYPTSTTPTTTPSPTTTTTPTPTSTSTTAPPAGTCSATLSANVNFGGSDVGTATASAPSGCCTACKSVSGAGAFTFMGGTCYCKSSKGTTNAQTGVTSGVLDSGSATTPTPTTTTSAPGTCTLSVDTDFTGSDAGAVTSTTANGCCTACKSVSGATAFSFMGNTCYCKSSKGSAVAKTGVTSGVFA